MRKGRVVCWWRAGLLALTMASAIGAIVGENAEALGAAVESTPGPAPDATPAGPEPEVAPTDTVVLDLAAAQRMAIADNPSLKAAEERVKQAQERVKQAQSRRWPQVSFVGGASNTWISERDYQLARYAAVAPYWSQFALTTQARLQGEILQFANNVAASITDYFNQAPHQSKPLPPVQNTDRQIIRDLFTASIRSLDDRREVDDSFETYRASVIANWILFNGFERKFSIAEARFGARQAEATYLEAHRLLLSAVAQAYHAAQLAREDIAIAEADEKFNLRQLEEAKARRRVGTGSLSDELNFEVRVNAARAALITARQNYKTALIALAQLLALREAEFPETMQLAPLADESFDDLKRPEPDGLIAFAKDYRPDLHAGELGVARADAAVGRARAPFYPSVAAQVSKDAQRSQDAEFREDDFSTTIGVNVTYEIFAGGRNVARLKETKSVKREAEHNLYDLELQVASDVRQALEELLAAQDRLVLQRANAAFVQRNRDLVEKEYAGGVGSLVRLNEAQRDLVAAQGNLAFARVQLRQAWHNVRTATAETIAPYVDHGDDRLADQGQSTK